MRLLKPDGGVTDEQLGYIIRLAHAIDFSDSGLDTVLSLDKIINDAQYLVTQNKAEEYIKKLERLYIQSGIKIADVNECVLEDYCTAKEILCFECGDKLTIEEVVDRKLNHPVFPHCDYCFNMICGCEQESAITI